MADELPQAFLLGVELFQKFFLVAEIFQSLLLATRLFQAFLLVAGRGDSDHAGGEELAETFLLVVDFPDPPIGCPVVSGLLIGCRTRRQ